MTKNEAIEIIRKEYLCVDRDCDIEKSCGKCDLMMPSKEPILEAYKMAMQALEHEQALGEAFNITLLHGIEKGMEAIDKALYQMGMDGIKEQEIKTLEQKPCEVSEYDKDHIWYKGHQYISLRRFLEVKAEAEQEPKTDTWSIKDVADTLAKHGLIEEQESCEDAISRQYLIDIATKDGAYDYVSAQEIANAPSVNSQPKTGYWIYKQYGGYPEQGNYHCSECDKIDNRTPAYCPNCGCRMVEPQERSDKE